MLAQSIKTNRENTTLKNMNPLIALIMLTCIDSAAFAEDSFQQNALFNPSMGQLLAENSGRVMIYDGLKIETVNKAMDEQYDRIDNMMFVRTEHPQKDEETIIEDEDCD